MRRIIGLLPAIANFAMETNFARIITHIKQRNLYTQRKKMSRKKTNKTKRLIIHFAKKLFVCVIEEEERHLHGNEVRNPHIVHFTLFTLYSNMKTLCAATKIVWWKKIAHGKRSVKSFLWNSILSQRKHSFGESNVVILWHFSANQTKQSLTSHANCFKMFFPFVFFACFAFNLSEFRWNYAFHLDDLSL